MAVMRVLLGPALVPEDLQPVLVVPAERPKVGQHLVHELDVARSAGVTDLLPPLRDHEVPRPEKSCNKIVIFSSSNTRSAQIIVPVDFQI